MENTKNMSPHGGKRPGAGRPKEIKDPVTINFFVERADLEAAKEKYGRKLNSMLRKWLNDTAGHRGKKQP